MGLNARLSLDRKSWSRHRPLPYAKPASLRIRGMQTSYLKGAGMRLLRFVLLVSVFFLSVLSASSALFAQGGSAELSGRVTDPNGLAVVGAKVQAVNTGTNGTYPTETNEIGLYNLPTVPPGTYRITVEKEGFEQV